MNGLGYPTGNLVPETLFGYDPTLPVPPVRSRAARRNCWPKPAGPMVSPSPSTAPTIAWSRTRRSCRPSGRCCPASASPRRWKPFRWPATPRAALKGKFSFGMIGFGSQTGESSSDPARHHRLRRPEERRRPLQLEFLLQPRRGCRAAQALHTVDDSARLKLLQQAAHLAMTTEAIIPLQFQATTWAAAPASPSNPAPTNAPSPPASGRRADDPGESRG